MVNDQAGSSSKGKERIETKEKSSTSIKSSKIADDEYNYAKRELIFEEDDDDATYLGKLPEKIPPYPMNIICPYCNMYVTTKIDETLTTLAIILSITFCCFTCCWKPWKHEGMWERKHYCPKCEEVVAEIRR